MRKPLFISLLAFAVILVATQSLQQYSFFAKELEHLWLNDASWIGDHFAKAGGVAQLLTSAASQFYGIMLVGPVLFSVLCTLMALALYAILRSIMGNNESLASALPLTFVPSIFLFLSHENTLYNYNGDTALLIAVAIASVYVFLTKRFSRLYWLPALILPALTYWISGSSAIVTVGIIILNSILSRKQYPAILLAPMALVAMAWVAVSCSAFPDFHSALTPLQYYEWPSTFFFQIYAWASVLLLVLILPLFLKHAKTQRTVNLVVGFAVVCAMMTAVSMFRMVHSHKDYVLRQEEWFTRQHDWQAIIDLHAGEEGQTCFISYLNLALAKRGELTERLFEFNPYVVSEQDFPTDNDQAFQGDQDATSGASRVRNVQTDSLSGTIKCMPLILRKDEQSRDGLKILSAVQMEWGGAALCNAQKSAFEANLNTPGYADPVELQRLVITNTVFESPRVADKYLRRLALTTCYSDWAERTMADKSELNKLAAKLRKTLPENSLYLKSQIGMILRSVMNTSPDNTVAAQFYEAFLLLTLDSQSILQWAETMRGKKKSRLLQQALCVYASEEQCRQLGVAEGVLKDYKLLVSNQLPDNYEYTFWNFYAQHN